MAEPTALLAPVPAKPSPVPRILNDNLITALCTYVAKGNYAEHACHLCGFHDQTLYTWLQLARKDREAGVETIYTRLDDALKRAKADSQARMVEVIQEAATVKRDWLPAITFLERTDPAHWGRRDRTQIDITEHKAQLIRIVIGHDEPAQITEPQNSQRQVIEGEASYVDQPGPETP